MGRVMLSGSWVPINDAAILLDRTYKRDKDGKFGSGGGVRDSLGSAGTTGELAAAAAREARRITGHDVAFDFGSSDIGISREHAEGVLRGLEDFPATPLRRVQTATTIQGHGHEEVWGSTSLDGSTITFAHVSPAAADAHRESLDRYGPGRPRELSDPTPMGTALHEVAHAAANGLRLNDAGAAVARRYVKKVIQDDDFKGAVGYHVSMRAMENDHELVAEAYADVKANGSNASGLSQVVVDAMHSAADLRAGGAG